MTAIELAKDLIRQSEGLRLDAYRCPAGRLTIGYGHTGADVVEGMAISAAQAEQLLDQDVAAAQSCLAAAVTVDLVDGQTAACLDFIFNLGAPAFFGSTLLRKINAGDTAAAADEFLRWDKAHVDGRLVELPGLANRRAAERELFLS